MKRLFYLLLQVILLNVICSAQWKEMSTGVKQIYLNTASAVNDSIFWAAGDNGLVVRTTNGGQTWEKSLNSIPAPNTLDLIYAINDTIALISTSTKNNTWVYRTTDGGKKWTQVFTQPGGFIDIIWFISDSSGLMIGDPVGGRWSLWRTNNAGATWDSTGMYLAQVDSEIGYVNSFAVFGNEIFFATNSSRVYHSTNFGKNWSSISIPLQNVYSMAFNDAKNGIITSDSTVYFKTTDGGLSWTRLTLSDGRIWSVAASDSLIFAIVHDTGIYGSSDKGSSWVEVFQLRTGIFDSIVKSRTGKSFWVVTSKATVVKGESIGNLPLAVEQKQPVPDKMELWQNYPNPFNPSTTINFSVPSIQHVTIKVFDMRGKEVAALVNEDKPRGNYSIRFDASYLSSGIYYLTLSAGNFSKTMKLILLK